MTEGRLRAWARENEKILAECYRPMTRSRLLDGEGRIRGIVSNLEQISFNFGPTLFRYIEAEDPETEAEAPQPFAGTGNVGPAAFSAGTSPDDPAEGAGQAVACRCSATACRPSS